LSYSNKDHLFAELAETKLAAQGIEVWRDQSSLMAGSDWRQGIERGISESVAVLVVLSTNSAESSYVTYEWAYALGNGKPIIPIKITECKVHPRLETIQYLDFSIPRALPWKSLVERVHEIETVSETVSVASDKEPAEATADPDQAHVKSILVYLNKRGYQMASFDRIRRRVNEHLTDEHIRKIIEKNPTIFRPTTLQGGKLGLAKLVP
jgi:hypothetical protein